MTVLGHSGQGLSRKNRLRPAFLLIIIDKVLKKILDNFDFHQGNSLLFARACALNRKLSTGTQSAVCDGRTKQASEVPVIF